MFWNGSDVAHLHLGICVGSGGFPNGRNNFSVQAASCLREDASLGAQGNMHTTTPHCTCTVLLRLPTIGREAGRLVSGTRGRTRATSARTKVRDDGRGLCATGEHCLRQLLVMQLALTVICAATRLRACISDSYVFTVNRLKPATRERRIWAADKLTPDVAQVMLVKHGEMRTPFELLTRKALLLA